MTRPRVLLLCGGRSDEHEVSLASARSVMAASGGALELTPLVIAKDGRLLPPEGSLKALTNGESTGLEPLTGGLERLEPNSFDVVWPLLHGPYGEDGSVQGLLKVMGLPFVGSDVLGSAVGMDKAMMKAVFAAHGLPNVPYQLVTRRALQEEPEAPAAGLEALPYPLFVKPANLGSSVGISRAEDRSELKEALELAARFDRRIVVEQGLVGARELEVGVLGNDAPEASVVGEIGYAGAFYDYESKYTAGEATLQIPADLPEETARRCRALALAAFRAVDAAGLARVDLFLHEGTLYLNEINTMPGFTQTSMYPKLWEASGVPYTELIERLIRLALGPR